MSARSSRSPASGLEAGDGTHPTPGQAAGCGAGRVVRAGPFEATLEGVWLRWIRVGGIELLRAVYGAVRSVRWDTIEPAIHDLAVREEPGRIVIEFDADHVAENIDFRWHGAIRLDGSGSLEFEMDGAARAECLVGRIGICVLHPDTVAGVPLTAETAGGSIESAFPATIEPDRWLTDLVGVRWQVVPGLEAHLQLEGDLFEIEDQRNWTDSSFKIFSRPLRLPWSYRLAPGERVRQVARVVVSGTTPTRVHAQPQPSVIVEGGASERPMLALGTGWPRSGVGFSEAERQAMLALGPAHLRVVVDLGTSAWRDRLSVAIQDAASIGCALEIEAIEGRSPRSWDDLGTILGRMSERIARVLVFSRGSFETTEATLEVARDAFARAGVAPSVPIGGGSRENFAELNRSRTRLDRLDLVAYPISAEAHASDDASIIETLRGQSSTAERARELAPGRPLAVGPIMLRPFVGGADSEGARQPMTDRRQASPLTAGWLAGSIGTLVASGATAATYFEAVGAAGFMDRTDAPPVSWISPGALFPAFHVFRALSGGGFSRGVRVAPEGLVAAAARRLGSDLTVVVANLTLRPLTIAVALPWVDRLRVATIDEAAMPSIVVDPRWLDHAGTEVRPASDVEVALAPRAIAVLSGSLP